MNENTNNIKRRIKGFTLGLMLGGTVFTSQTSIANAFMVPNITSEQNQNTKNNMQKDEKGNIISINEQGIRNLKKYFETGNPDLGNLSQINMESKVTKIILAYECTNPEFNENGDYAFTKIEDPNICGGVKAKYSLTTIEWLYNNQYLDNSISLEQIKENLIQRNLPRFEFIKRCYAKRYSIYG